MIWHLAWKLKDTRIGKVSFVIKMEPLGDAGAPNESFVKDKQTSRGCSDVG